MVRITQQKGFLLIGLNMLVNCACSLTYKWQSKIKVYGESFSHPFMQTLTMFIGEALCFVIFLSYKNIKRENYDKELKQAEEDGKNTKFSVIYVIIPTIFDMITSCLAFFALGLMPVSVYSMIRGTSIVMTAIFQVVFLKRWPIRAQMFGMFLIVVGNLIVGIVVYLKSDDDAGNLIIGVIFLLFSFMTTSGQLIIEEKYFDQYYLNAFQLVGLEGIWGIGFTILMLFGLEFIPCPSAFQDGCPKGDNGNYYLEQSISFMKIGFDLNNSDYQPQLFLSILGGCFTILLMNSVSMMVLQYLSALTKNVVQVSTITLIWLFSLFFGWEKFYWQQLIGFLILICGSMIYNKVIQIPCLNQKDQEVSDESLIKEEVTSLQSNQN